jgi:hypothetical protein
LESPKVARIVESRPRSRHNTYWYSLVVVEDLKPEGMTLCHAAAPQVRDTDGVPTGTPDEHARESAVADYMAWASTHRWLAQDDTNHEVPLS